MSLIEHLEGPTWREFLSRTFSYTLDVLETDPHQWVGSSVDDLRTWLRTGSVPHARMRLGDQARERRLSTDHQAELIAAFDALVEQHRPQLFRLAGSGVIPAPVARQLHAGFPTELDVLDCLARMAAGERPFEGWMRQNGRSEEDIAVVYAAIDGWLAHQRGDRTLN
ncbi:MAG: hypothetical protein IPO88_11655 [Nannocystis sp.]|uniref:hypothetical protein n=1 Tax=Nannocystis sp. TaxID=1962667 RepID=UPI0024221D87|nr:hypothetical protein [Nannocystis sp.]MBK9754141.1 hypothetical protein [Nannocystis sp.]